MISKDQAGNNQSALLWPLGSDPGSWYSMIYGFQWFAFAVANVAVLPVFLGSHLGLDQVGIADYGQRMFLFVGLASLLPVVFNGASNLMAGVGASVGTVSFAASTGLVKISGVASRKPFIIYCLLMTVIGFFPQAGALLARIPQPVGYAVLLVAFTQLLIVGLQELKKMEMDQRDSFVIGLAILVGAGVASLPETTLVGLPDLARYIFGNALIVGMIICILMEHVILPRR